MIMDTGFIRTLYVFFLTAHISCVANVGVLSRISFAERPAINEKWLSDCSGLKYTNTVLVKNVRNYYIALTFLLINQTRK